MPKGLINEHTTTVLLLYCTRRCAYVMILYLMLVGLGYRRQAQRRASGPESGLVALTRARHMLFIITYLHC